MKRVSIVLIFFLIAVIKICNAQKYDYNWVFGDSVGIDFNNLTSPVTYVPIMHGGLDENYASVSDSSGNLLFYLNYDSISPNWNYSSIYNKNYLLMDNGDSIPTHRSCTQGMIIIPFINDTNKYYLIYLCYNSQFIGLYYAVVDMSMNSGDGKVISKNNLLLAGTFTEKLTAVRHGNGRDWWIFTHDLNNAKFNKILLTTSGFSPASSQFFGPIASGGMGQMVFSPKGSRLCVANQQAWPSLGLFDFDRCTGMLSNWKTINIAGYYGCSFSPDESKLYLSSLQSGGSLYQYNLDSLNFAATQSLIFSAPVNYAICQHLLGPDNKIYIASEYINNPNTIYSIYNMNLTVINNPDSAGANCNVSPYSFYLGGKRTLGGLPNMVNYRLEPLPPGTCDSAVSIASDFSQPVIKISPNPFSSNITLSFLFPQNSKALLKIYNIIGEAIVEKEIFLQDQLLDLSELQQGIYLLSVRMNNGFYTQKIVHSN